VQAPQKVMLPLSKVVMGTGHRAQELAFQSALNVPFAQGSQRSAPPVAKVPGAQRTCSRRGTSPT